MSRDGRENRRPHLLLELWEYIRERRAYWIILPLVVLMLIGGLLALAQGPLAPFIYALF
jgi:hypothetical protein